MEINDLVQYTDFVSRIVAKSIPEYDVEDVSQDVMEDAIRSLPRFRGESNVYTWLRGIAKHDIADYYRARNRQKRYTPRTGFPSICDPWDAVDERIEVEQIMDFFPNATWQDIFALRLQGFGDMEISRETGLSYATVRGRYKRALLYARGLDHD